MLSFHLIINVIIIVVSFKILDLCPIALFQQLWNTLYISTIPQPIHRTATARLAVDTIFTMETSISRNLWGTWLDDLCVFSVPRRFSVLSSISSAINSVPPNKSIYLSIYSRHAAWPTVILKFMKTRGKTLALSTQNLIKCKKRKTKIVDKCIFIELIIYSNGNWLYAYHSYADFWGPRLKPT